MGMDEIWARLAPDTQDWLIANNGDAIPADIAAEIDELVDATGADEVWAFAPAAPATGSLDPDDVEDADGLDDEDDEPGARYLAEEVVDWIEEYANDEDGGGTPARD
ncbi:hypothetical protein [Microbacterium sp. NPDC058389]|uniref:hypothetical protein n=1 Tax=Microbacterium sp. NPDC058389 TaxID=3346475 RepID=UPI00364A035D